MAGPHLKAKAVLLLASTMTVMAGATIIPSLPRLEKIFATAPSFIWLVPLIVTMPGLLIALISPFAGAIVDTYGRKKPLLIGLVCFVLSGSTGLYVNSVWLLLFGRALLGTSVALVMTATIALIADYFKGRDRERFMGYQAAAMGIGALLFILVFLYFGRIVVAPLFEVVVRLLHPEFVYF